MPHGRPVGSSVLSSAKPVPQPKPQPAPVTECKRETVEDLPEHQRVLIPALHHLLGNKNSIEVTRDQLDAAAKQFGWRGRHDFGPGSGEWQRAAAVEGMKVKVAKLRNDVPYGCTFAITRTDTSAHAPAEPVSTDAAKSVANRATAYIAEQKKLGNEVSAAEAVAAVMTPTTPTKGETMSTNNTKLEPSPTEVARAAQDYQKQQAAQGRRISTAEAVEHVRNVMHLSNDVPSLAPVETPTRPVTVDSTVQEAEAVAQKARQRVQRERAAGNVGYGYADAVIEIRKEMGLN